MLPGLLQQGASTCLAGWAGQEGQAVSFAPWPPPLLVQVVGRKYIRFYRPEDTEAMYPFRLALEAA